MNGAQRTGEHFLDAATMPSSCCIKNRLGSGADGVLAAADLDDGDPGPHAARRDTNATAPVSAS